MAFFTNGLQDSGLQAGIVGNHFVEFGDPNLAVRCYFFVYHPAVFDHIVGDDQGPGVGELDGEIQIIRVLGFFAINEDQVKGWLVYFCHFSHIM